MDFNEKLKFHQNRIKKTYILIPAFNEDENLVILLQDIFSIYPEINVIVINSELENKNRFTDSLKTLYKKNFHIIKIKKKNNFSERGYAVKEGIKYALNKGAEIIIEMDADYSHRPYYISEMIKFIDKYDIVIGSRYINGSCGEVGRSFFRKFLSRAGNLCVRYFLGLKNIRDCTSGFRCYKSEALLKIGLSSISFSDGTAVLIEMLYRAVKNNLKIKEIPIIYYERKFGRSKFSFNTVIESIKTVFYMRKIDIF